MKMITPLKFGLIAGISAIIIQVFIYIITPEKVSTSIWMFIVYLPVLFFMIFGGITYRKECDGQISFGNSLLSVFIVSLLGIVFVNVFTYEILMQIIDPNLFQTIIEHAKEAINELGEKQGLSDEMIQKNIKGVEMLTIKMLRNIAWGISGFFTIFLSLLVALFVKRSEQQIPIKFES